MIVETLVIEALKAGLIGPPAIYYGTAPQPEGNAPAPMPVVLVNRGASAWSTTFCGLDQDLAVSDLQVDVYARTNEISRELADQARLAVAAIDPAPSLENEFSIYDSEARAWRVIQTWRAIDYRPRLR